MRKIMKVAAIAALIAAPIEVRAQTIDTAVENAFTLGDKRGGPVVGIVSGTVAGFFVAVEVIAERLLGGQAAGNPPVHPTAAAVPKTASASSGTKTASAGLNPQPRYEGRSIGRRHSGHRPHHV
jgi:hypothetical protein